MHKCWLLWFICLMAYQPSWVIWYQSYSCSRIVSKFGDSCSRIVSKFGSFSLATTLRCKGRSYSFPWLPHFIFDQYLIILSVKVRLHQIPFLSRWYDSTWDWTQVFQAIGEHSTHYGISLKVNVIIWPKFEIAY